MNENASGTGIEMHAVPYVNNIFEIKFYMKMAESSAEQHGNQFWAGLYWKHP